MSILLSGFTSTILFIVSIPDVLSRIPPVLHQTFAWLLVDFNYISFTVSQFVYHRNVVLSHSDKEAAMNETLGPILGILTSAREHVFCFGQTCHSLYAWTQLWDLVFVPWCSTQKVKTGWQSIADHCSARNIFVSHRHWFEPLLWINHEVMKIKKLCL